MVFSILAYLFLFWRYLRFCIISDDVIGCSTKTAQHSIENNSRNIKAVFFKLGTSSVHHKRNRMTPTMVLPWQHSWLQSLSVKNKISPFATFKVGQRVLLGTHTYGSHTVLTLPIRLVGVDHLCLR